MIKDITLTDEQRRALERLWFVWGNNGPKSSHSSHKSVQTILEQGEYYPEFYKTDPKLDEQIRQILGESYEQ